MKKKSIYKMCRTIFPYVFTIIVLLNLSCMKQVPQEELQTANNRIEQEQNLISYSNLSGQKTIYRDIWFKAAVICPMIKLLFLPVIIKSFTIFIQNLESILKYIHQSDGKKRKALLIY